MNRFEYELAKARKTLKITDKSSAAKPSIIREKSPNELNAIYQPPNYGILFCCHGRSYFDTCPNCRRTRKRARSEYIAFCVRNGLEL
jgi:hypothetical protein